MAIYTGKSGQKYEFADTMPQAEVFARMGSDAPSVAQAASPEDNKAPSFGAFLWDKAKSGPTAGLKGISTLANAGINYVKNKVTDQPKDAPPVTFMNELKEAGKDVDMAFKPITDAMGIKNYQPRDTTEKVAGIATEVLTDPLTYVLPGAGAFKGSATALKAAQAAGPIRPLTAAAAINSGTASANAGVAAARYGQNAVAGLAGAASSSVAKDMGFSEEVQLMSGLLGGAYGVKAVSVVSPVARAASIGKSLFQGSSMSKMFDGLAEVDKARALRDPEYARSVGFTPKVAEGLSKVDELTTARSSYLSRNELNQAMREGDRAGASVESSLANNARAGDLLEMEIPSYAAASSNGTIGAMAREAAVNPEFRGSVTATAKTAEANLPAALENITGVSPSQARDNLMAIEPNAISSTQALSSQSAAMTAKGDEAIRSIVDMTERVDPKTLHKEVIGAEAVRLIKENRSQKRAAFNEDYKALHAEADAGNGTNSLKENMGSFLKDKFSSTVANPDTTFGRIYSLTKDVEAGPMTAESVNSIKKSTNDFIREATAKKNKGSTTDIENTQLSNAIAFKDEFFGVNSPNNAWDTFGEGLGKKYRELDTQYHEAIKPTRNATAEQVESAQFDSARSASIIQTPEKSLQFLEATGPEGKRVLEDALLAELRTKLDKGSDVAKITQDWASKYSRQIAATGMKDEVTKGTRIASVAYTHAGEVDSRIAAMIREDVLAKGIVGRKGEVTARFETADDLITHVVESPKALEAFVAGYQNSPKQALQSIQAMAYEKAGRSSNPEAALLQMVEKNPRLGKLLEPNMQDAMTVLSAISGIRQTKGTGNAQLQKPLGPLESVTGTSFQSLRRTLVGSILSTPSKFVRITGDYADKAASDKLAASRLAMLVDPSVMAQEAAFIRAHGVTDTSTTMMANVLTRSIAKTQKLWAEGNLKGAAMGVATGAAVGAVKGVAKGTNVPQAVNEAASDSAGFQPIGGAPQDTPQ